MSDGNLHIPYSFPPVDLLEEPDYLYADIRNELRETAQKLIFTLDSFGIKAKLVGVSVGAVVSCYEVQTPTNSISQIKEASEDLSLNLANDKIRITPILRKNSIGIEIPNETMRTVKIREIIESKEFNNTQSALTIALGKDVRNNIVLADLQKLHHLLIAGNAGSGKNNLINAIIMSILYKSSPDEVRLILLDPTMFGFNTYNGMPHLLVPVVTEHTKIAGALNWVITEINRRYEQFASVGVKNYGSYNIRMDSIGGARMPHLVIILKEPSYITANIKNEIEDYIYHITQRGNAVGIHLIMSTTHVTSDIITPRIKDNILSKIVFSLSDSADSMALLNTDDATLLCSPGDMLYRSAGTREAIRIQCPYISENDINKVKDFIFSVNGKIDYSDNFKKELHNNHLKSDEDDPLLNKAIELAQSIGRISTSMIQRRLNVNYARAGHMIDQMEAKGIVSGANGSKPREVINQVLKKKANISPQIQISTKVTVKTSTLQSQNRAENTSDLVAELDALVGLNAVKQDVHSMINLIKIRKMREQKGLRMPEMSNHLVFCGNPGTGKTTVARLLANIYYKMGLLSKGHLVETDRAGLVAGYVGQTALKTKEVLDSAKGGILFIDEAYTLASSQESDFGREAVDTILKYMEDNRNDLIVIVAGYTNRMQNFINSNPGLQSRFNKYINFDDYSANELVQIFQSMCQKADYALSDSANEYIGEYFQKVVDAKPHNFSNGRFVRNCFEKVITNQANRLSEDNDINDEDLQTIEYDDVCII